MATPRSAGRTLAVPERTGRTTHDRDAADPATTDSGAVDLDVRTPQRDAPQAKNALPYGNRTPSDRSTTPGRPAPVV